MNGTFCSSWSLTSRKFLARCRVVFCVISRWYAFGRYDLLIAVYVYKIPAYIKSQSVAILLKLRFKFRLFL